MRLKCTVSMEGPGPSEAIVAIHAADGSLEEVVVDKKSIINGYLDVGPRIASRKGETLVELPREAASGRWRLWVSENDLQEEEMVAA